MRDEAKKELGEKFNLKAFHDEIPDGGAMPLDLLQDAWKPGSKIKPLTSKANDGRREHTLMLLRLRAPCS